MWYKHFFALSTTMFVVDRQSVKYVIQTKDHSQIMYDVSLGYRTNYRCLWTGSQPFYEKISSYIHTTNTLISILFLREESSQQRYMNSYLQDDSGDRQYSASNLCVRNSIFWHFVMVIMCCGPSYGLWLCVCALNRGCTTNIQKSTSTSGNITRWPENYSNFFLYS